MKLIPPRPATQDTPPADEARSEAKAKLNALDLLNSTGEDFAEALERAVKRVAKQDRVQAALALVAFLRGGISMLQSISRADADAFIIDAQTEQEGTDGHTTRNRAAGRRARTTGRNKPRTAAGRTPNVAATDSTGDAPVKRGRGRPKGSKNKKTLAREAAAKRAASLAKRAARIDAAAKNKRRVVTRPAKRAGHKPATARKGRQGSRRKGAAKKVSGKR